MQACAVCGAQVDASAVFLSKRGEVCASCNLADEPAGNSGLPPLGIAGLVAGLGPFFLSIRSGSTQLVNGTVVQSSAIDYVALGGGCLALLAGAVTLATSRNDPTKRRARFLGAAALALGALQLLRAFGTI